MIRLVHGVALAGVALAMAGCSTTTYGTGVGTTAQLVQDIANIVNFGPGEQIIYCERPPLEGPQPGAPLPEPQAPGEEDCVQP